VLRAAMALADEGGIDKLSTGALLVAEEPNGDVRPCVRDTTSRLGQTIVGSSLIVLPGTRG